MASNTVSYLTDTFAVTDPTINGAVEELNVYIAILQGSGATTKKAKAFVLTVKDSGYFTIYAQADDGKVYVSYHYWCTLAAALGRTAQAMSLDAAMMYFEPS